MSPCQAQTPVLKPVSTLVTRLVRRDLTGHHFPPALVPTRAGEFEFMQGTRPEGRERLSVQHIFVIPRIWRLKIEALWERSLFLAKGNALN